MNKEMLESIVQELMERFGVFAPPVPIEDMLRHPPAGMWEEVDPTQLSSTFLTMRDKYSPRMSVARLLVRHIAASAWGAERGLEVLLRDSEALAVFARMLIMPREMMLGLSQRDRIVISISNLFEAPQEDAEKRMTELEL